MNKSITIILLAITLIGIQVAGSQSQSWHLLDVDYAGTSADDNTIHYRDLYMNKTGEATSGALFRLPNDETAWWYAEYEAEFDDLSFGENDWIINLSHGPTDDCTIWANVCKMNSTTGEVTFLANGSVVPSGSGSDTFTCYDSMNSEQTFSSQERLALRIYHNRSTSLSIYYYNLTNERYSNLSSPSTDPGYPVPELGMLTLVSLGLIALSGYAYVFKNKKGK